MNNIGLEINFNIFCYKVAKENLSLAFNSASDVFASSIIDSQVSLTLKGRCIKLTQASGLVLRAILLCIPLINKISQLASKKAVLSLMQKDGIALKYVSKNLKADSEVARAAIHQNPEALQFAHKDMVLTVLKQKSYMLKYSSEILREDKDFMLDAVEQNGDTLEYASKALKKEREAVKKHSDALERAFNPSF